MSELHQTATDAMNRSVSAVTAMTVSTGFGTALEIIPQVLGCFASAVGIVVTIILFLKKRKIYNLQISKLEAENEA